VFQCIRVFWKGGWRYEEFLDHHEMVQLTLGNSAKLGAHANDPVSGFRTFQKQNGPP
jgi:hypothetical protein